MIERNAIYVDGAWVPSGGTGTIDVYGAATEEVVGRIPDGVAADVDRAVAAAKAAFPAWSGPSTSSASRRGSSPARTSWPSSSPPRSACRSSWRP
jgi:aldehyde dehydrogenase (NAD+)